MEILTLKKENLKKIIAESYLILKSGGFLVYPTDTCYGLGALTSQKKAIEKIYKFKNREEGKPFSVIVPNLEWILKRIQGLNQERKKFILDRLPGPYTFIVKIKKEYQKELSPVLLKEKLGFRYPDNLFCQKLAQKLSEPFTTTSANVSGSPPAYSLKEFKKYLSQIPEKNWPDLFIDNGELPKNSPSKIIDISIYPFLILRQ